MNKQKSIFILFILISAINALAFQASRTAETLRILTINVWSGLDYSGYLKMGEYETAAVREQRYQALVTQIKQLDPDLIGIQEANKLPDYAERLAKDTGYEVFFHMGVGGLRLGPVGLPWNLREGDALLAKKILQPQFAGRKKLSGGYVGNWAAFHFSDATQVIAVKIAVRNRPLYIFVTHWHASLLGSPGVLKKARELSDTGEASQRDVESVLEKIAEGVKWRLSESKKTVAFIQETADEHPFILMGDFNAESGSEEITQLLQFGMVDLFHTMNPNVPGFTWDPGTNLNHHQYYLKEEISGKDSDLLSRLKKLHTATPKRIDYIFLGPADLLASWKVSIKSSSVVMDEVINGAHASDHYGVFAEIEFRE